MTDLSARPHYAEIGRCAAILQAGGLVAYPTEAVYGLGCDPHRRDVFERLLALKQRPANCGVLLIGADFEQLRPYIDLPALSAVALERVRASWPGPHTWILPRAASVPDWIGGDHEGIALRQTAHVPAADLCRAFGGALVSTSANRHGKSPVCDAASVRAVFGDALDAILDAAVGGAESPTDIRDARTGVIIRS